MTDFKTIPLKSIHPDENQPRKFYDELAMAELTESVKEKGILQPILLRPNGKGYKLVCGERRYRAATAAGLKDIPAVIRELTDDEALELQIIENLQRKDVNPMEEGSAFKMLKDKFSIEEIAHRIGKGPAYVAQRMKLTDMTGEWQDLSFADKSKLTLAFKIARLPEKSQREIYKEARVPKDWTKKKDWEISSWISAENHKHELDKASFKTDDADLYPEAGACNTCQHNSHFNKLLFPELQKKRICHNGVCFQIKSQKAYQQTIEKAMQDPDVLFVTTTNYLDSDDKKKVKAAEELGATVLSSDMINCDSEPEAPEPWEEFMEEQKDSDCDFDEWDELSAKDKKAKEAEWRDDYNDLVSEYEQELKEHKEAEAAGLFKKAFVVVGHNYEGQIINVRLKGKKGIATANAAAGDNVDLIAIEQEIAEINDRERRNKELDREKVYRRLTELFKADDNIYLSDKDELTAADSAALLYTLADNCYLVHNLIQEELSINGYGENLYKAIFDQQFLSSKAYSLIHRCMRLFIAEKLINQNKCDHERNGKAAAIYALGKENFKSELDVYELEQEERATKRQKNIEKRLNALAVKKSELQAAAKAKPAPAAKKSTPKKSPKK